MSLLKIARLGHPCLRQRSAPVSPAELASAPFQQFIDDMIETMHDGDGVGLAANQVHALKRPQAETAAELDSMLPAIRARAFKGEL